MRRRISRTATYREYTLASLAVWLWSPLGGSPEEQSSLGKMDIFQEGNLKSAGAGHTHMLKDQPARKNTEMDEHRALYGNQ